MTYAVWQPTQPIEDLRNLSDFERRISFQGPASRAVWNLDAIQAALAATPPLAVIATPKAQTEMLEKLSWSGKDALGYLRCLTRGRYAGSQWCYAPKGNTAYACDVYLMGYDRHAALENQQLQPWAYVKFGFIGPAFTKLAFFS